MVVALAVSYERWSLPFVVTYDMGIQLNASMNLLEAGRPLSDHFTSYPSNDLSAQGSTRFLTWFPPGFTYAAAGALATGLPLVAALKIFDSIVLLGGWLGWALVARLLLPTAPGAWPRRLVLLLLALFPLSLSPWAGGTDGVLWATAPWVVLLCAQIAISGHFIWRSAVVGLLIGNAVCFRYTSLFLLGLPFFSILAIWRAASWRKAALAAALNLIFLAGPLALLMMYNRAASAGDISPGYNWASLSFNHLWQNSIPAALKGAPIANSMFGLSMLDRWIASIKDVHLLTGISIAIIITVFGLMVISFRKWWREPRSVERLSVFLVSLLPLCLIAFLFAASMAMAFVAIGDGRYYMAVLPALPLLGLSVLTQQKTHPVCYLIVLLGCTAFVADIAYFRHSTSRFPLSHGMAKSPLENLSLYHYGKQQVPTLLSSRWWLDMYSHAAARAKLAELEEADPAALFFVQHKPYFEFDRARSKLREISLQNVWKHAYSSRPLRLVFVVETLGDEVLTSLTGTPVIISDRFPSKVLTRVDYWTFFEVDIPANEPLFMEKSVPSRSL